MEWIDQSVWLYFKNYNCWHLSLRGNVWVHTTSFIQPLYPARVVIGHVYIYWQYPLIQPGWWSVIYIFTGSIHLSSQGGDRSCIYLLAVSTYPARVVIGHVYIYWQYPLIQPGWWSVMYIFTGSIHLSSQGGDRSYIYLLAVSTYSARVVIGHVYIYWQYPLIQPGWWSVMYIFTGSIHLSSQGGDRSCIYLLAVSTYSARVVIGHVYIYWLYPLILPGWWSVMYIFTGSIHLSSQGGDRSCIYLLAVSTYSARVVIGHVYIYWQYPLIQPGWWSVMYIFTGSIHLSSQGGDRSCIYLLAVSTYSARVVIGHVYIYWLYPLILPGWWSVMYIFTGSIHLSSQGGDRSCIYLLVVSTYPARVVIGHLLAVSTLSQFLIFFY